MILVTCLTHCMDIATGHRLFCQIHGNPRAPPHSLWVLRCADDVSPGQALLKTSFSTQRSNWVRWCKTVRCIFRDSKWATAMLNLGIQRTGQSVDEFCHMGCLAGDVEFSSFPALRWSSVAKVAWFVSLPRLRVQEACSMLQVWFFSQAYLQCFKNLI